MRLLHVLGMRHHRALYANRYEPLGRVVKESILFSIFGEAAEFFGSGVILVVRQELGSTYD